MNDEDRVLALDGLGLSTEAIGPHAEWQPVPRKVFQRRHNAFWGMVAALINTEPGDYDDLPDYMTEIGSQELEANN